jgi:hypothetical protein
MRSERAGRLVALLRLFEGGFTTNDGVLMRIFDQPAGHGRSAIAFCA